MTYPLIPPGRADACCHLKCDNDRKWARPGLHGITMWSRVFCKARTRGCVALGFVHSAHMLARAAMEPLTFKNVLTFLI